MLREFFEFERLLSEIKFYHMSSWCGDSPVSNHIVSLVVRRACIVRVMRMRVTSTPTSYRSSVIDGLMTSSGTSQSSIVLYRK